MIAVTITRIASTLVQQVLPYDWQVGGINIGRNFLGFKKRNSITSSPSITKVPLYPYTDKLTQRYTLRHHEDIYNKTHGLKTHSIGIESLMTVIFISSFVNFLTYN